MSDKKGYQAWPAGPPAYAQGQSQSGQDLTQNTDWNYSIFDCFTPGSVCE